VSTIEPDPFYEDYDDTVDEGEAPDESVTDPYDPMEPDEA